jgi:hypothetical protein
LGVIKSPINVNAGFHGADGWKESESQEVDLHDKFSADEFAEFLSLLMVTQAGPLARVAKTTIITNIPASIKRVCSHGIWFSVSIASAYRKINLLKQKNAVIICFSLLKNGSWENIS